MGQKDFPFFSFSLFIKLDCCLSSNLIFVCKFLTFFCKFCFVNFFFTCFPSIIFKFYKRPNQLWLFAVHLQFLFPRPPLMLSSSPLLLRSHFVFTILTLICWCFFCRCCSFYGFVLATFLVNVKFVIVVMVFVATFHHQPYPMFRLCRHSWHIPGG